MLFRADSRDTAEAIAYALRGRQWGRWVIAKPDRIAATTAAELEDGKIVLAIGYRDAFAGLMCSAVAATATLPFFLAISNQQELTESKRLNQSPDLVRFKSSPRSGV